MVTDEQRARLHYLREDLLVWNERRKRARWSLAVDRIYNCSAMDKAIKDIQEEIATLEKIDR